MHNDGNFISFSILLNGANEFEGGGTYFDDGLTCHLNQGDMIVHSGLVKHSGLPVTKGVRYLLVGFVDMTISAPET
jgi:predicted 2-oxoglutarate/Fe(II)-dependent dioxygenase YbiX